MADLLAGSTVQALDTPPTVADDDNQSYTFTNTSFGVTTTGGTYVDVGAAFVAPTTGRVAIHYGARMVNSTTGSTIISPHIRTGTTVGSGTDVDVADLDFSIAVQGTNTLQFGAARYLEGLTAGSDYNVRLEHRVTSGTGTALRRYVIVTPCT